jgi:hypothetical protein
VEPVEPPPKVEPPKKVEPVETPPKVEPPKKVDAPDNAKAIAALQKELLIARQALAAKSAELAILLRGKDVALEKIAKLRQARDRAIELAVSEVEKIQKELLSCQKAKPVAGEECLKKPVVGQPGATKGTTGENQTADQPDDGDGGLGTGENGSAELEVKVAELNKQIGAQKTLVGQLEKNLALAIQDREKDLAVISYFIQNSNKLFASPCQDLQISIERNNGRATMVASGTVASEDEKNKLTDFLGGAPGMSVTTDDLIISGKTGCIMKLPDGYGIVAPEDAMAQSSAKWWRIYSEVKAGGLETLPKFQECRGMHEALNNHPELGSKLLNARTVKFWIRIGPRIGICKMRRKGEFEWAKPTRVTRVKSEAAFEVRITRRDDR